jgi:hypothetical protein
MITSPFTPNKSITLFFPKLMLQALTSPSITTEQTTKEGSTTPSPCVLWEGKAIQGWRARHYTTH